MSKVSACRLALLFICLNALTVTVFLRGFLLSRLELPNISKCKDADLSLSLSDAPIEVKPACWSEPAYDRAVLVIVDALRYDFVFGGNSSGHMPKMARLLAEAGNAGVAYKFVADTPTITISRLKAILTGSLPTFLDIGQSFSAAALSEDNLLTQMRVAGLRVVVMGDDTWAQLAPPDSYSGCHPYPAFNVRDLHTVDDGVWKHLMTYLRQEDTAGASDRPPHTNEDNTTPQTAAAAGAEGGGGGGGAAAAEGDGGGSGSGEIGGGGGRARCGLLDTSCPVEGAHSHQHQGGGGTRKGGDVSADSPESNHLGSAGGPAGGPAGGDTGGGSSGPRSAPTFDVLVAHYLGVDHAGHTYGGSSQQMRDKLAQMDSQIEEVTETLLTGAHKDGRTAGPYSRTLLLVLGDHGQTMSGDHGGGSDEERDSVLLAFDMGQWRRRRDAIATAATTSATTATDATTDPGPPATAATTDAIATESSSSTYVPPATAAAAMSPPTPPPPAVLTQIDLTPSLALLLGLPVPYDNLGKVNRQLWDLGHGFAAAQLTPAATDIANNKTVVQHHDGQHHRRQRHTTTNSYLAALRANAVQVDRYLTSYDAAGGGLPSQEMAACAVLLAAAHDSYRVHHGDSVEHVGTEVETSEGMISEAERRYEIYLDAAAALARGKFTRFDARWMAAGCGLALCSLVVHVGLLARLGGLRISHLLLWPPCGLLAVAAALHAGGLFSANWIQGEGRITCITLGVTGTLLWVMAAVRRLPSSAYVRAVPRVEQAAGFGDGWERLGGAGEGEGEGDECIRHGVPHGSGCAGGGCDGVCHLTGAADVCNGGDGGGGGAGGDGKNGDGESEVGHTGHVEKSQLKAAPATAVSVSAAAVAAAAPGVCPEYDDLGQNPNKPPRPVVLRSQTTPQNRHGHHNHHQNHHHHQQQHNQQRHQQLQKLEQRRLWFKRQLRLGLMLAVALSCNVILQRYSLIDRWGADPHDKRQLATAGLDLLGATATATASSTGATWFRSVLLETLLPLGLLPALLSTLRRRKRRYAAAAASPTRHSVRQWASSPPPQRDRANPWTASNMWWRRQWRRLLWRLYGTLPFHLIAVWWVLQLIAVVMPRSLIRSPPQYDVIATAAEMTSTATVAVATGGGGYDGDGDAPAIATAAPVSDPTDVSPAAAAATIVAVYDSLVALAYSSLPPLPLVLLLLLLGLCVTAAVVPAAFRVVRVGQPVAVALWVGSAAVVGLVTAVSLPYIVHWLQMLVTSCLVLPPRLLLPRVVYALAVSAMLRLLFVRLKIVRRHWQRRRRRECTAEAAGQFSVGGRIDGDGSGDGDGGMRRTRMEPSMYGAKANDDDDDATANGDHDDDDAMYDAGLAAFSSCTAVVTLLLGPRGPTMVLLLGLQNAALLGLLLEAGGPGESGVQDTGGCRDKVGCEVQQSVSTVLPAAHLQPDAPVRNVDKTTTAATATWPSSTTLAGAQSTSTPTEATTTTMATTAAAPMSAAPAQTATPTKPALSPQALAAGCLLYLSGTQAFFLTGHFCEFSGLQYDSPFVGFDTMMWSVTPLLFVLNSFGGLLLTAMALPLVVRALRATACAPSTSATACAPSTSATATATAPSTTIDTVLRYPSVKNAPVSSSSAPPQSEPPRPQGQQQPLHNNTITPLCELVAANPVSPNSGPGLPAQHSILHPSSSRSVGNGSSSSGQVILVSLSCCRTAALAAAVGCAALQRGHVVLWALFAPKLLFEVGFAAASGLGLVWAAVWIGNG